jgi:hypothetical protein
MSFNIFSTQKNILFLFISFFLLGNISLTSAQHQVDAFSDEDLKQFAHAAYKIINIQEESHNKMIRAIEETDLSLERFNEMLIEGQEGGEHAINATEKELEAFNESIVQVQFIQREMQLEMMDAINQEGLDVDKYQQLMHGYENDEEVRTKVDLYMNELE